MIAGKRLLSATIDDIAVHQPDRIWLSIAKNNDPSSGFTDITFRLFANAINHAANWMNENIPDVETFAYEGPYDARIPILAVAASKLNKKILLLFGMASTKTKLHLLGATRCTAFLCDASQQSELNEAARDIDEIACLPIPPPDDWVTETKAGAVEYDSSWESAKLRPSVILHSSGTTGLPKPIVYTNEMMTQLDVAYNATSDLGLLSLAGKRVLLCTGLSHSSGVIFSLQLPTFAGASIVLCSPTQPPNVSSVLSTLHQTPIDMMVAAPVLFRDLARTAAGLAALQNLSYVTWAGAPLDSVTGDALSRGPVKLLPGFGTTECGQLFTLPVPDARDWAYLRFAPRQGIVFRAHGDDGAYELVLTRDPAAFALQQIFKLRPELDEWRSGDLYRPHRAHGDMWRHVGRRDDMLVLLNGLNVDAPGVEAAVGKHADVDAVFVGGQGRPHIFVIVDTDPGVTEGWWQDKEAKDWFWAELRPLIAEANEHLTEATALKERYILIPEGKRLPMTAKGQVDRKKALEIFHDEIEGLFRHS